MPSEAKFSWTKDRLEFVLQLIADTYVQKATGKDLSTNDFTDILLSKLNGIAAGAEKNVIQGISLSGTAQVPDVNRVINIPTMSGANASNAGVVGLVPKPAKGDQDKFLKGDGSWAASIQYDDATTTEAGLMSASDKTKLNGIAENATANIGTVTKVHMNGKLIDPGADGTLELGLVVTQHQPVDDLAPLHSPEFTGTPTVPTAATSTNGTQAASTAFVHSVVDSAISGLKGIQQVFVSSLSALPATGDSSKIYFVPNGSNGTNYYDEYIWLEGRNAYEKKGSADIDLSGYMKAEDYPVITESEILTMFNGT